MEDLLRDEPGAARDAAPDWETQREELHCPMCEYNLRGLAEPRCPECGYQFEWRDVLDVRRRIHPYLFEHHPERNVWSFWKTALAGLRPFRFWTSLSPTHLPKPRRLLLYWVVVMAVALLGALGPYLHEFAWLERYAAQTTQWINSTAYSPYRIGPNRLDRAEIALDTVGPGYLVWLGWSVLWPWLTLLTLMIFQFSMRRAKVSPIHVVRCVLYSSEALLWAGTCLLVIFLLAMGAFWFGQQVNFYLPLSGYLMTAIALLCVARLCIAYQLYLRFDHPIATVLASQLIVFLIGVNAVAFWSVRRW